MSGGAAAARDWSWFLILFLLIYWLSQFYGNVLGEPSSGTEPFALAVLSTLGFFGAIVLHELGHAVAARRNGIGISSIQLWIFGGVARMDRDSETPKAEFEVAIGGPLVTLAIVLLLGVAGTALAGWSDFSHVPHLDHVKVVGAVNHAAIFPACRAVVHHGGAGTTAIGLRAGVPTLVLWMLADQPIWGAAVKRLKVGAASVAPAAPAFRSRRPALAAPAPGGRGSSGPRCPGGGEAVPVQWIGHRRIVPSR